MRKKIVVVGSSNTDMVVKSSRIPMPGETILGGNFIMAEGGKGANQAATIAKLKGEVIFVARVGDDLLGNQSVDKYIEYGINTKYILKDTAPSGVAIIMIDEKGENCISVASGANANLSKEDIDYCRSEIESAAIILMQLETPIEIIEYVAEIATQSGAKIVLNPAPMQDIKDDLLKKIYLITPNESEAKLLCGVDIIDLETAKQAAIKIAEKGPRNVIITLGSKGSLIYEENKEFHFIAARKVNAVDTTGAGDVYNGALCVALAEEKNITEAAQFATISSSISVTRLGAQTSIPTREEVNSIMSNLK